MEKKMKFKEEERDILSSLPNDILSSIISYLPLQEAIRTSILSRRWAHTWWGSITYLSIDLHSMNCRSSTSSSDSQWIENVNRWISIVDSILGRCQGSIRDCQIECCPPPRFNCRANNLITRGVMERLVLRYERWAEILTRGVIERLAFKGNDEEDKVPCSILNCNSLRFLQLHYCPLGPKSLFNGCRNLKALTLVSVELTGHQICDAISRCVHLERLDLMYCTVMEDLTIHAQNLKYLYLWLDEPENVGIDIDGPNLTDIAMQADGKVKRLCVRAPNLRSSCVNMSTDTTEEIQMTSYSIWSSFQGKMNTFELCSLSNKNILELQGRSIEVLAADNMSRCLPTPFNMLRKLSIQVNLKYQRHSNAVKFLLRRCPCIQELSVELNDKHIKNAHYWEEPYPECWDVDELFCCLDACLEEVWVSNFMAFDYEVEFAKFIMANARMLKRMSIIGHSLCHYQKDALQQVAKDLISSQKASSYACLNLKI